MKIACILMAATFLAGCGSSGQNAPSPYRTKIIGMWENTSQGYPIKITKDTIYYYPEHIDPNPYVLTGDSLTMILNYGSGDDKPEGVNVSFKNDTLIWKNKNGVDKFLRVNQQHFNKLLDDIARP